MSILYDLKKQFGVYGHLYQVGTYTPDYSTGKVEKAIQRVAIEQIIPLGQNVAFAELIKSLRTSPDAMYQNDEGFLFDCNDLPNGWQVGTQDYLIINNQQFTITHVDLIEVMNAIYVKAKSVKGKLSALISITATSQMALEGATNGQL
jgi:hypothetical protein